MRFRINEIISEVINKELFVTELEAMRAECDKFLNQLGLYLYLDYDYEWDVHDDKDNILACYEVWSVFEGCIDVALNCDAYINHARRLRLTEDELIQDIRVCVWHEIGHGIIELFEDYASNGAFDDLDRNKYRNLSELLSNTGSDEEDIVENFGRSMVDGGYSLLKEAIEEYITSQKETVTEAVERDTYPVYLDGTDWDAPRILNGDMEEIDTLSVSENMYSYVQLKGKVYVAKDASHYGAILNALLDIHHLTTEEQLERKFKESIDYILDDVRNNGVLEEEGRFWCKYNLIEPTGGDNKKSVLYDVCKTVGADKNEVYVVTNYYDNARNILNIEPLVKKSYNA